MDDELRDAGTEPYWDDVYGIEQSLRYRRTSVLEKVERNAMMTSIEDSWEEVRSRGVGISLFESSQWIKQLGCEHPWMSVG